jgi:hypothetical protein
MQLNKAARQRIDIKRRGRRHARVLAMAHPATKARPKAPNLF